jgi:hypothetical protein
MQKSTLLKKVHFLLNCGMGRMDVGRMDVNAVLRTTYSNKSAKLI